MGKKSKLVIIILILIILGVLISNYYMHTDEIKIGNTYFTIPNGYYEGTLNENNDTNITNGENTLFITKYNDNNLTKQINNYKEFLYNKNYSYEMTNYTIDNNPIYKLEVENGITTYYWFIHNEETYSIYSWEKIDNIDQIVFDIIKTAN